MVVFMDKWWCLWTNELFGRSFLSKILHPRVFGRYYPYHIKQHGFLKYENRFKNLLAQKETSRINPSVLSNVNANCLTHLESKMNNEGSWKRVECVGRKPVVKGLKQHRVMWRNLSYLWAQNSSNTSPRVFEMSTSPHQMQAETTIFCWAMPSSKPQGGIEWILTVAGLVAIEWPLHSL